MYRCWQMIGIYGWVWSSGGMFDDRRKPKYAEQNLSFWKLVNQPIKEPTFCIEHKPTSESDSRRTAQWITCFWWNQQASCAKQPKIWNLFWNAESSSHPVVLDLFQGLSSAYVEASSVRFFFSFFDWNLVYVCFASSLCVLCASSRLSCLIASPGFWLRVQLRRVLRNINHSAV